MTLWWLAALLFGAALSLGVLRCLYGTAPERLVGLNFAGVAGVLTLLVVGMALGGGFYFDVALLAAIVLPIGTLVFTFFLERWL